MTDKIIRQKEIINEIILDIGCEIVSQRESESGIILSVLGTFKQIAHQNMILAEKISENDFLDDYPKIIRFSSV